MHVGSAQAFGDEVFDAEGEEFLPAVPEHSLGLPVDQHNSTLVVHDHDAIGRGFEDESEHFLVIG